MLKMVVVFFAKKTLDIKNHKNVEYVCELLWTLERHLQKDWKI